MKILHLHSKKRSINWRLFADFTTTFDFFGTQHKSAIAFGAYILFAVDCANLPHACSRSVHESVGIASILEEEKMYLNAKQK